jgi:tRNA G18 (ribose-2'-O)-methylase SpoU
VARGARSYDEVDLAVPVALVLGSEAHGLPLGARRHRRRRSASR